MYMCQLSAGGSTIPWIIKTAPPHICLILKSFKLLEYQWQENVYLIKTNQKLPGAPPSVYDYGNLNDSSDWYGLDCTQNDLLILLLFWVVGRPGPQFSTSKLPSEITSCSEAFRPTWSSSESKEYLQDSNSRVCEKKPC